MTHDFIPDVVALERAEIEAAVEGWRAAPPPLADALGLTLSVAKSHIVTAMTSVDVLAQNRAIGLGLDDRPADDDLAEVLEAFARIGCPRYFVPVAPTPHNADLSERLVALGLRRYNAWMRLRRDLTNLPDSPASSLTVRRIHPHGAEEFGRIVADAFHLPPEFASFPGCTIGRAGWYHYLAFDDGRPIGAAAMFVTGQTAWFGFAATQEDARGRGAQTALIVRRLHDAAAAGCRFVSVETAQPTGQRDVPSFRNLQRLGFEVAYERPNYLWTRPSTA